jgi:hypothetical protein
MPLYHAQTVIAVTSGLTADYAVNNTYWIAADVSELPAIGAELKASYDLMRPYMASFVPAAGHVTKFYDTADPEPRAPKLTYDWVLATAPTGSALPTEVSLCCSFQGDPESGVPQARRRGRNYLPFLGGSVIDGVGRPSSAVVSAAVAWGQNLLDFSGLGVGTTWVVHSTIGDPLATAVVITNGWVDNEFDTQRRRGRDATARTTFS